MAFKKFITLVRNSESCFSDKLEKQEVKNCFKRGNTFGGSPVQSCSAFV